MSRPPTRGEAIALAQIQIIEAAKRLCADWTSVNEDALFDAVVQLSKAQL